MFLCDFLAFIKANVRIIQAAIKPVIKAMPAYIYICCKILKVYSGANLFHSTECKILSSPVGATETIAWKNFLKKPP